MCSCSTNAHDRHPRELRDRGSRAELKIDDAALGGCVGGRLRQLPLCLAQLGSYLRHVGLIAPDRRGDLLFEPCRLRASHVDFLLCRRELWQTARRHPHGAARPRFPSAAPRTRRRRPISPVRWSGRPASPRACSLARVASMEPLIASTRFSDTAICASAAFTSSTLRRDVGLGSGEQRLEPLDLVFEGPGIDLERGLPLSSPTGWAPPAPR